MEDDRHRCKLCSKLFSNGRALGGHMSSHLSTLPLPPQLGRPTHSDSSSTTRSDNLHGESEPESTQSLTRPRSRRSESVTESTQASSVSDQTQVAADEEVAVCLMMLSRDRRVWGRREKVTTEAYDSAELTREEGSWKRCKTNKALLLLQEKNQDNNRMEKKKKKIYECPFCGKVFGSGQALGGHKRSHLFGSSINNNNNIDNYNDDHIHSKRSSFLLDLNLPAPMEDDDHSQLQSIFSR